MSALQEPVLGHSQEDTQSIDARGEIDLNNSELTLLPLNGVPEVDSPANGHLGSFHERDGVAIYLGDAMKLYRHWKSPTVIISDGPYGVAGFPGDPPSVEGLPEWYEPHVVAWSTRATPETTMWFWNTELGWATVHPVLQRHGWIYRSCHVWDKGNWPHRRKCQFEKPPQVPSCQRKLRSVREGG